MNIEKELFNWAKETIEDYNNTGYSYYTQSPLNQIKEDQIELLVLGINPGSGQESFEDMKNKKESLWKELLSNEGMTPTIFLQGNPYYKNRDKWPFWRNFNDLLKQAGLLHLINDDNSFAYSNIYCGSTANAKGLPVEKFSMHCFKLIEILKPKRIICFGQIVMDELLKLYDKDRNCYVEDLPIRYKKINNIKVFGFHHPASRYTTQEKELVAKFLEYYDNNDLSEVDPKNPLPTKELKNVAEQYRTRNLFKALINNQCARQSVWKGSTFVYEFYTDINPITNEYIRSNNMIVIDLVLLGNNEYEINVFTRNNDPEQIKVIATEIWGSYFPNPNDPSRHLFAKLQTADPQVIVNKMNELLPQVRIYRDNHYCKMA